MSKLKKNDNKPFSTIAGLLVPRLAAKVMRPEESLVRRVTSVHRIENLSVGHVSAEVAQYRAVLTPSWQNKALNPNPYSG